MAIEQKSAEKGFRVLHTHDVAATLAEKGFPRELLKIIEICNAKYTSQVLDRDVKIPLMLPCPIRVYVEGGQTHISTLLPTSSVQFSPHAGIEALASDVESIALRSLKRRVETIDVRPGTKSAASGVPSYPFRLILKRRFHMMHEYAKSCCYQEAS